MTGRGHSVAGLLIRCAAMGALGASVGALVFLRQAETTLLAGVTVAAAVLGALVAVLTVAPEPSPPARHVPPRRPTAGNAPPQRPRPAPPAEPVGRPEPVGPADRVRLLLPVEAAPHAGWWNGGPADRTAVQTPTRAEPARPPAPELATYRRPARTVQCPRCGAFRIDVQETGSGYAFRCRVDDHTWTWRAGTAWPVTVVASRRRPGR